MANGQLLRAELNSSALAAGRLFRAEFDSVQVAAGQLVRAELDSTAITGGVLYRAELDSGFVAVSGGPAAMYVEPWSTVVLQGTGGTTSPLSRAWSQTGGPAVTLTHNSSGDSSTFTAPGAVSTLLFEYAVDGATADVVRVVMSPTEFDVVSDTTRPVDPHG